MSQTNESVVLKFADRVVNKRTGDVSWKGNSLCCESGELVSYGWGNHVFAVARPEMGMGEVKYSSWHSGGEGNFTEIRPICLKNGDIAGARGWGWGRDNRTHLTQKHIPGPTASFRVIQAAGLSPYDEIDFWTEDKVESDYCVDKEGQFYLSDWKDAKGDENGKVVITPVDVKGKPGMFIPHSAGTQVMWLEGEVPIDIVQTGWWHVLGTVVFRKDGMHFLCSLDNGRYFISQLPYLVKDMKDAWESLKPRAVIDCECHGIKVKRQGEWFFVPVFVDGELNPWIDVQPIRQLAIQYDFFRKEPSMFTKMSDSSDIKMRKLLGFRNLESMREKMNEKALPQAGPHSNAHCVRGVGGFHWDHGLWFVKGKVFHRTSVRGSMTREHPTVKLDDWCLAMRNTAVQSWSDGGGRVRFD